ncbi:MAG: hypothetical protein KF893_07020 [Caldilineaceae bacterium]|nr:hypothetical protein [Caldilineaceae bacterium]
MRRIGIVKAAHRLSAILCAKHAAIHDNHSHHPAIRCHFYATVVTNLLNESAPLL